MRPLGLVLLLLLCGPSSGLQPLEDVGTVVLVEELENPDFEAETGLNLDQVKKALQGKALKELEAMKEDAKAKISSAKQEAADIPLNGPAPVDVMKHSQSELNYRHSPSPEDSEARQTSKKAG